MATADPSTITISFQMPYKLQLITHLTFLKKEIVVPIHGLTFLRIQFTWSGSDRLQLVKLETIKSGPMKMFNVMGLNKEWTETFHLR